MRDIGRPITGFHRSPTLNNLDERNLAVLARERNGAHRRSGARIPLRVVRPDIESDSGRILEKCECEDGICGISRVAREISLATGDGFGVRTIPENDLIVLKFKHKALIDTENEVLTVTAGALPVLYHAIKYCAIFRQGA